MNEQLTFADEPVIVAIRRGGYGMAEQIRAGFFDLW
jgi:hypothetical protein